MEVRGNAFANADIYQNTNLVVTACCDRPVTITPLRSYRVAQCHGDRIAGLVALAADDVRARGRRVYVSTMQPGRFVDSYLAEGYDDPISIQP
ncbi:hypothetical protein FDH38_gp030 [Dinoroseobacter phage vB_DshS-R5C]|uniref:Uncharacterized protein n=1 Tax=Dinoroseobacter phage vB_DshS-R5C TaxID=1965368 RepID=A0A1V0DY40_9CAUD|nr:hypothetical protein FDH38_gp030 [Dinoroseobacter phage vB_DshS-R5C]ARB06084.1 hypothetical protein vBDshSR5C_30 [Dinoroseobacter phage vB_DshS-R5C]